MESPNSERHGSPTSPHSQTKETNLEHSPSTETKPTSRKRLSTVTLPSYTKSTSFSKGVQDPPRLKHSLLERIKDVNPDPTKAIVWSRSVMTKPIALINCIEGRERAISGKSLQESKKSKIKAVKEGVTTVLNSKISKG